MKKYYEFIKYDPDEDLEQEDEVESLSWTIIGWNDGNVRDYTMFWDKDDWVYILQEEIDDNHIIFYNDNDFRIEDIQKYYAPLTKEELEKYIYSNKKRICIYNGRYGRNEFVFFDELPEDIKKLLK